MYSNESKYDHFSENDTPSLGYEAFDIETMSQLTQVLVDKSPGIHSRVDHIVHLSTIPLASVLNLSYDDNSPILHENHNDMCKNPLNCMFRGRKGFLHPQTLQARCPCRVHEDAKHVCFLSVLPSIGYRLDPTAGDKPEIPLSNVMWCADAQTIFDASYGAFMQRTTHKKGWHLLQEPSEVLAALEQLYWFRFVAPKIKSMILARPIASLKSILYNVIQTLDGLLLKLFFCFPLETRSYASIANRTASMFGSLLQDYFATSTDGPSKVYSQLKPMLQEVGLLFHSRDPLTRLSIVDGALMKYNRAFWFFQHEMTTYRDNIREFWSAVEVDLTESLSWKTRMAMFCKTRILGHVPECDAYPSDIDYLKGLEVETPPINRDLLRNLARSVPLAMHAEGVQSGGLRELYSDLKTESLDKIIEEIDLDVKLTADTVHTRAEGGKCESGRVLIDKIREMNLEIPVRNLVSGRVVSTIKAPAPNAPGYKRAVFWASVQILTQDLAQRFPEINSWPSLWPEELLADLFHTRVVRIDEPGKIRRLVKTSNEINAGLAVGSHLLAVELAKGKSHQSGMLGSAQAWNFEIRLDRKSPESAFLFTADEKSLRPDIVCGFQDWSRASDFVPKPVGLTLLAAAHRYVAFPEWYGTLIRMALGEPLSFDYRMFNTTTRQFEERRGWIRNGFMMGLQNTKNILHLIHYSAGFYAEFALISAGWVKLEKPPEYDKPIIKLDFEDLKSSTTSVLRTDTG